MIVPLHVLNAMGAEAHIAFNNIKGQLFFFGTLHAEGVKETLDRHEKP